jgi:hypothetical protein
MDIKLLEAECLAANAGYISAQGPMLDAAQKVRAEIEAAEQAGLTERVKELRSLAWLCDMGVAHHGWQ